ncbi:PTS glucose transporter subunit IIA [Vagococcus sp. DIV0080]|uniref:PTS glucose transporter subunit IIA n=1 Tax=Candidatus Vagococcus giribetii TaxID=2230876 RepID=A0ABS3HRB0_9ENTE|nr:beta-glucoside-specific PTS transporter subunit IIABC [Vagococcus sp. DIV0080]MBO0475742.1 PTS glucose transporter subunit IIA [Vagococcus sp. DIV0080]
MTNLELAKHIVASVGGSENIETVYNCATRLRFVLKDKEKFDIESLKVTKGVIGAVQASDESQVIIGPNVDSVIKEIFKEYPETGQVATGKSQENNKNMFSKVLDTIIGIFAPLVPALAGAGMIKAVLAVLVLFGLSKETQNYYILNFISDAVYYFMPMLLSVSAANRFKTNQYFAIAIAGVLLHPSFSTLVATGDPVHFFGVPVTLVGYASTAVPVILCVWFMSYVEKFAEKVSPNIIKALLRPLLVLLITAPVALIIIGPIGSWLGNVLSSGINYLDAHAGWLVPTVLGATMPLLVSIGMHVSLTPLVQLSLASKGYETITGPAMLASNISQGGASLAVALKTKNKERRQIALSSGITALCGITEPALYGVTMPLKRPLLAVMISGGVAGLYAGLSGVVRISFGSPGFPTLPVFITEDPNNLKNALITMAIALVLSFVLTYLFGFKDDIDEITSEKKENHFDLSKESVINSPVEGTVLALSETEDVTFSSGALGKGVSIMPIGNKFYAPKDGKITMAYETGHAIGLTTEEGIEILIHIGIDTVKLQGKYFDLHVSKDDEVKAGDLLVSIDKEKIEEAGYCLISPIVILNSDHYLDVVETKETYVQKNDKLLTVIK